VATGGVIFLLGLALGGFTGKSTLNH